MKMMNRGSSIALVAFLALMVNGMVSKAAAQSCTRESCPPGPVVAHFQYSNCTGEVQYYGSADTNYGECFNYSTKSGVSLFTETYLENRIYDHTIDCGQNSDSVSYTANRYYFGVCFNIYILPTARRAEEGTPFLGDFDPNQAHAFGSRRDSELGILYLRSINDTLFDVPQDPINMEIPKWDVHSEPCFSPNNCTSDEGEMPVYYNTLYSNDTCAEADSSSMFTNFTADTCYRNEGEEFYTRIRCLDSHTLAFDIMIGNGCEFVVKSEITHSECGSGRTELICNALPAIPSPDVTSPDVTSPTITPTVTSPDAPSSTVPSPTSAPIPSATPSSSSSPLSMMDSLATMVMGILLSSLWLA